MNRDREVRCPQCRELVPARELDSSAFGSCRDCEERYTGEDEHDDH